MLNITLLLKVYQFEKCAVPNNHSKREEFAEKLAIYGVSLSEYMFSLEEGVSTTKYVFIGHCTYCV